MTGRHLSTKKESRSKEKHGQEMLMTPSPRSADARKETDRQSIARLAAIGAKEGVTNAIQEKIGSAITGSILETSNDTEFKTVDQIELHVLLKTVLGAMKQPNALDARNEFKAFTATRFDFHGKLVNAVEQLQVKVNKAKGCSIIVNDNIIVLITMSNVEWVAR